jgi:ABC-type Na+ efflux pump permease subunit
MIALIERGRSSEGSLHVAWAHWTLAAFYTIGFAQLLRILYRAVRFPGPDDSVFGVSMVVIVLCILIGIHILTGRGARQQKDWARIVSRIMAFFLFLVIPIGTAFALFVLRNTRPDRWAVPLTQIDK